MTAALLLLPLIYEWSESRVEARRLAAERAEATPASQLPQEYS